MWNLCGKFDGSSASFRGVQLSTFSFFSFLVCVAPRKDGKVLIDLIITGDLVFVLRRPCSMEFASVRGKRNIGKPRRTLFCSPVVLSIVSRKIGDFYSSILGN